MPGATARSSDSYSIASAVSQRRMTYWPCKAKSIIDVDMGTGARPVLRQTMHRLISFFPQMFRTTHHSPPKPAHSQQLWCLRKGTRDSQWMLLEFGQSYIVLRIRGIGMKVCSITACVEDFTSEGNFDDRSLPNPKGFLLHDENNRQPLPAEYRVRPVSHL